MQPFSIAELERARHTSDLVGFELRPRSVGEPIDRYGIPLGATAATSGRYCKDRRCPKEKIGNDDVDMARDPSGGLGKSLVRSGLPPLLGGEGSPVFLNIDFA